MSEAYAKRDNWASALCTNVIVRGDMKYLQDFRCHHRLTAGLVQDAIERYVDFPSSKTETEYLIIHQENMSL